MWKQHVDGVSCSDRPRVLYVGDSRGNCSVVFQVFYELGFDVANARCYREALSWINRNKFALVFSEEHLSDGAWVDLLSRFVEISEAPPIVLLSADTKSWAQAINLGAQDVLLTPISERELRHVADSALDLRALQR